MQSVGLTTVVEEAKALNSNLVMSCSACLVSHLEFGNCDWADWKEFSVLEEPPARIIE
jgi:hypothetical protein